VNARANAASGTAGAAWYRQPVAWLGILLLAASLAGCVAMIVLGVRHADEPVPTVGGQVFKVPAARPPPASDRRAEPEAAKP
jgi:hypothetical protein